MLLLMCEVLPYSEECANMRLPGQATRVIQSCIKSARAAGTVAGVSFISAAGLKIDKQHSQMA